jgi:hypothetical protein
MMSQKFRFVGQSARGRKGKWSLRAQAFVISANLNERLSGAKAFEIGVERFNASVAEESRLPLPLPKSYTSKNASSLLFSMKTRFLAKLGEGNVEVVALAQEFGIKYEPKV